MFGNTHLLTNDQPNHRSCIMLRYYVRHGCAPTERYQSFLLYGIHTVVFFICLICCVTLYAITGFDSDSCA